MIVLYLGSQDHCISYSVGSSQIIFKIALFWSAEEYENKLYQIHLTNYHCSKYIYSAFAMECYGQSEKIS